MNSDLVFFAEMLDIMSVSEIGFLILECLPRHYKLLVP